MLDAFQSGPACSEAIASPRRHPSDWNCCLVVLSPMKIRRLPLMHWLKAAASQGFKMQVWGWKTCMTARALLSSQILLRPVALTERTLASLNMCWQTHCRKQVHWSAVQGWSYEICMLVRLCPYLSILCMGFGLHCIRHLQRLAQAVYLLCPCWALDLYTIDPPLLTLTHCASWVEVPPKRCVGPKLSRQVVRAWCNSKVSQLPDMQSHLETGAA